jgi:VWFA-related protein
MRLWSALTLACLILPPQARVVDAQAPVPPPAKTPTLNSNSTLVLVPALVRNKAGELIFTLKADDFVLTDNGIPQKLKLEQDTGGEPLALVIDIQGGGSALRELAKFSVIGPMIDSLVGNVPHKVAVVGFDSSPVLVADFTSDTAEAAHGVQALIDDNNGDGGAAILDSLGFSIDLLRSQPPQYRRAILLISETNGDSSKLKFSDALRSVSDTNTTIYSVGFATGKSDARQIWAAVKSRPPPPPSCDACLDFMPEIEMAAMAGVIAIDGLRRNVPETVANLTGGEYLQFADAGSLARDLQTISNHIPNRYILSFQPQSPHPGFHAIVLTAPKYTGLEISARSSYWANPPAAPTNRPQDGPR